MSTNCNEETLVKRLSQLSLDNRMTEIAMLHAAQTDCLSIALPRGLGFMSKPLKDGNSKIDKSVLVFDLPAVESCRNCASCAKTCYAVKSQVQYWEVLAKRSTNFWLAKNEPAFLFHHEVKLYYERRIVTEHMEQIVLATPGAVDVPERFSYKFFIFPVVFFLLQTDGYVVCFHCFSS